MSDPTHIYANAERLRALASTLSDASDVAVVNQYAQELEERARQSASGRVSARVFWPHPGFADAQLAMLRTVLPKVFAVEHAPAFDDLVIALDD